MSVVYPSSLFLFISLMLNRSFLSLGEVQLFRISKSNISKEIGDNISLIWEYNVTTNRDAEFKSTSPIWFFDKNGTESKIAFEDQFETPKWKWTISNDCPEQFLKPKQRIHKEGKATLFITNLSLSDSGKYTCKIELISGSDLSSSVQLFVVSTPTTAAPTATATTPSSSNTTGSTTKSGTDGDSEALSDEAIAGISVAVIVVVVVIVVLAVCMWKKSKNNGNNGSNNKSGPLEMDKPPGDGNTTSPEA
ncbi:uncharacterized protein LOC110246913 isoform X2 [Exaiptasia diaphana]|uniref:Immunoglobulin domain-containing protein n=1 Tax=Exaiptasia diaphana TaxID=2652724 RepID=A0A913XTK7_EXADI|nr:uncharacterized protein LOC110246913 isoform X2 [Exaiptasia diaphana]